MKIGNTNSLAAQTPITGDRKTSSSKSSSQTSSTSSTSQADADSSAHVELSPAASLLSSSGADPSFDSAKVSRIAQAIKDGNFTINHGAIADKLIGNAQELLGRSTAH